MTRKLERRVVRAAMQPIVWVDGVIRFKANEMIVSFYEAASAGRKLDLNTVAGMNFSQEDREQFAQLIGYSISGYGDLSYVSARSLDEADRACAALRRAKQRRGK